MQPRDLALRAQDVEGGLNALQNLPTFTSSEFKNSFLVGKAARLAAHISGADVFTIEDIQRLEYVASSLGVDPLILPRVLDILQEADCVEVQNRGTEIVGVRENVPTYGDLYRKIGEVLASKTLTHVESATLDSFNELVHSPMIDDGTLEIQRLDDKYRVPLMEITEQAGLIRRIQSGGDDPLLFAPQYWDENYEETTRLLKEFGDGAFRAVHERIQDEPGLPLTKAYGFDNLDLANRMAEAGILPSPVVRGLKGDVAFAFTPARGFNEDPAIESKLMEKVRALLACVRYGQHYGTGSRIKYPGALLKALRDRKRLAPHSDAYSQYRLLYDEGIVRLERVSSTSDRFGTTFIDTEENVRAINAAISLLEHGTPVEATVVNEQIRSYAIDATYEEPTVARAKRAYLPSKTSQRLVYKAVQDIITS